MSRMNVLNDFPYTKHFYLTHPWKFLQECWWNLQAAWTRATKGHAWRDSVEMDEYLLHIIPSMLRDIAEGHAYPGVEPFDTYEKWQDWCYALADVFESVQEENWSIGQNEWEEEWHKVCCIASPHPNVTTTFDYTEEDIETIRNAYFEREKELFQERERLIKDAYAQLVKYHVYLWI